MMMSTVAMKDFLTSTKRMMKSKILGDRCHHLLRECRVSSVSHDTLSFVSVFVSSVVSVRKKQLSVPGRTSEYCPGLQGGSSFLS